MKTVLALLAAPVAAFAVIYVLWLFYLAVMNLQRARDNGTLTGAAYALGLPILYVGLVLDCLVNVVVLTILFLEIPEEALVTARLSRHIEGSAGYRQKLASWFCTNLLDAFDPSGCHCKH